MFSTLKEMEKEKSAQTIYLRDGEGEIWGKKGPVCRVFARFILRKGLRRQDMWCDMRVQCGDDDWG